MKTISRRQCEHASDKYQRFCRHPEVVAPQLSRRVTPEQCEVCKFGGDGFVELQENPKSVTVTERKSWRIGDKIARSLSAVGITKERVSRVLGRPCGCDKRQEAANKIGDAVQDAIFGK